MDNKPKHGGRRPGSGRKKGTLNKLTQTIKERAAVHGDDALSTMVSIMNDTAAPANVRLSAAGMLLDRGFGKPSISIDVAEVKISQIPWDELREITRQSVENAAQKHREVIEGRHERLGIEKEYHSD